ncbi:chemotaxis protein [Hydrogenimonas thermophila]|uniref:Two-component system, chemotaxis family, response regulator CheV n=1 Tax=Hydrogenimonas thermophila TaxID=223786 RepID=A0A1I5MDB7_9BACT|nr:chemotaxis protein [Hydrogenimonas thermophila]WOE70637.1 chemotaxis protein [Hydrogenimonas thermophila]WOE73155.1 chemotaxis protein [Hydrogenimonas thermophila]SFP06951.1 two-component system, chemotaxis family, response regulator CheV [Hydrogenimonas thermophila]
MTSKRDVLKVGTNELELVDFRILKEENGEVYEGIYGINVSKVREIIKYPKLTELPGVPDFIEGIFDLRGVVIPVVDLAKWMGIKVPENLNIQPRVIIAEFNNVLIGFVVHEAKRIRRINWNDIEPASFVSGHGVLDKSKITGVTRIENNEVLLILDLESVVEELGFYQPEIDADIKVESFSGMALILDDSATARKIVKDAMAKMGFTVIEAKDGKEGLEKLEELYNIYGDQVKNELKIIVSDVEMPLMDGFHFAARVKDDPRFNEIPIVFNSSISDHFSEQRGKDAGGEGYLVKFDANTFYTEVAKIVRSHIKN